MPSENESNAALPDLSGACQAVRNYTGLVRYDMFLFNIMQVITSIWWFQYILP